MSNAYSFKFPIRILKLDELASSGRCLGPVPSDPEVYLRRAGVYTRDAHPDEVKALARGVRRIEELSGSEGFSLIRDAVFQFSNGPRQRSGNARGSYNGRYIDIDRSGSSPASNVAHLIHELGHYVGNRGLYADYKATVKPCKLSRYSSVVYRGQRARNEEFAEAFGAFVTHPELLLKAGPNCVKAHQFFANRVFRAGEKAQCNGRSVAP